MRQEKRHRDHMTVIEYVKSIEGYYGSQSNGYSYSPGVREVVISYLNRYSASELKALFEAVILTYPNVYGKIPDVAIFERAIREHPAVLESAKALSYRPDGVYRFDQKIGHMDETRFIPDMMVIDAEARQRYIDNYQEYSSPGQFIYLIESRAVNVLQGEP